MFAPSFNLLPVAPVEFALSLQEEAQMLDCFRIIGTSLGVKEIPSHTHRTLHVSLKVPL